MEMYLIVLKSILLKLCKSSSKWRAFWMFSITNWWSKFTFVNLIKFLSVLQDVKEFKTEFIVFILLLKKIQFIKFLLNF
jgi:hypothetical protein